MKPKINLLLGLPYSYEKVVEVAGGRLDVPPRPEDISFWLVFADILEKKGLRFDAVNHRAIAILDAGQDLAVLESLGMVQSDLMKRAKLNEKFLHRLKNPRPEKQRKTLKRPKPVPVALGDILCFPADKRGPANPYVTGTLLENSRFSQSDIWRYIWLR